jgi:hypothetical protein
MNTNVKQRRPLNGFHARKHRTRGAACVNPTTRIPTTEELPEAPADLAEALDRWHRLTVSEREQARLAAAANGKADEAAAAYRREVRETLANGGDPGKVKNDTERHKAVAATHIEFHNDARNERARLGFELGPMLEATAPDLFAPIEERIEKSARAVRGSLTSVREAWAHYSRDFEMRRWLSHAALDGGHVGVYHGSQPLPREVAEALAVLDAHIDSLDKLKADEQEVREYRKQNGGDR